MAIIETTRPVPFGAVNTLRIVNVFDAFLTSLKTLRDARSTSKQLNGLSNRQLDDIGMVRCNIDSVSYQMATRRFV